MAEAALARFHGAPPRYLTSALLERERLPHLFSTRHFPGDRAPANPAAPFATEPAATLAAEAGLDGREAAFLKQVHGAEVIRARQGGRAGTGDVLTTDQPGLPLTIFTADCLPVVVYDPRELRLAVAHAGWRGTVQSVARSAVLALVEAGSRADRLVAAIGPSIGPCCYEVDRPVIDRLAASFPERWEAWVTAKGTDAGGSERWMLDLWAANEDQLAAADVDRSMIDNPRLCTACNLDRFYSYRREGSTRLGRLGRLVALAALPA